MLSTIWIIIKCISQFYFCFGFSLDHSNNWSAYLALWAFPLKFLFLFFACTVVRKYFGFKIPFFCRQSCDLVSCAWNCDRCLRLWPALDYGASSIFVPIRMKLSLDKWIKRCKLATDIQQHVKCDRARTQDSAGTDYVLRIFCHIDCMSHFSCFLGRLFGRIGHVLVNV